MPADLLPMRQRERRPWLEPCCPESEPCPSSSARGDFADQHAAHKTCLPPLADQHGHASADTTHRRACHHSPRGGMGRRWRPCEGSAGSWNSAPEPLDLRNTSALTSCMDTCEAGHALLAAAGRSLPPEPFAAACTAAYAQCICANLPGQRCTLGTSCKLRHRKQAPAAAPARAPAGG